MLTAACWVLSVIGADQDDRVAREQVLAIADGIASKEQSRNHLETDFLFWMVPNQPLAQPQWPADVPNSYERRRLAIHDGLLRLDVTPFADNGATSQGGLIGAWNGSQWWTRDLATNSVLIDSRPELGFATDCMPLFSEYEGPTIVGGLCLSELLRTGRLLAYSRQDSSSRVLIAIGSLEEVELMFGHEPELHLQSLQFDMREASSDGKPGELKTRVHYHVSQWSTFGGLRLPSLAFRDGFVLKPRWMGHEEVQPQANRIVFRREAARIVEGGQQADHFALEFRPGDIVTDQRYSLQYEVGSNELFLDGRLYKTTSFIRGDPSPTLAAMLASSMEPAPKGSEAPLPSHDRFYHAASVAFVATVLVLAAIIFGGSMRRQQRCGA